MKFEVDSSIRNYRIYMCVYTIIGIMSGVVFDTVITLLQCLAPETAKSFSAFMGMATFAGAAILLLAPKIGYKKVLIIGPLSAILALIMLNISSSYWIINISIFMLLVGVNVFDIVLAPFLSFYTTAKNRTEVFSKALYMNAAGTMLGTLIGGPLIVVRFSNRLGIDYAAAKLLTEKVGQFSWRQNSAYISSHKDVIASFILVLLVSLVPILMISEHKENFGGKTKIERKKIFSIGKIINKYSVNFLIYIALCKFAASLITPYVPAYLSRIHINRTTISIIGTAQYFATFVFMIISPYIIKRVGQVKTLGWLCIASVPFMFLLANGTAFGKGTTLVVGSALFLRSGLINATNPVVNSLPMELVESDYRAQYNSAIFTVQGVFQILSGLFTKVVLFSSDNGYLSAYYIAGVIFLIAHIMLLIIYTKNFNFSKEIQI